MCVIEFSRDRIGLTICDANFEAISIVQSDGTIVLSEYKEHPLPINFKPQTTFQFIYDEQGTLHLQLTGPFTLGNETLGYAVAHMKAHHITKIATDYTGLGESGETLLAKEAGDGNAIFIAPLRFSEAARWGNTVPKDQLNVPITQALQQNEEVFTDAQDYRGVSVFAATAYLPEVGVGIAVLEKLKDLDYKF